MQICIIGNGIAGISAAISARRNNSSANIIVFGNEHSTLFSRPALLYVFMHQMQLKHTYPYTKEFFSENNITLCYSEIQQIDFERNTLITQLKEYTYTALIIATGSQPKKLELPQKARNLSYFYSLQDLQKLEILSASAKTAVVVGGGLIGIELVEMLLYKNIQTTFISKDNRLFKSLLTESQSQFITNELQQRGVEVLLNCTSFSFSGGPNERLLSIDTPAKTVAADLFCIAIGVEPNLRVLSEEQSIGFANKGILVNQYLQTNKTNVYAAGDCAELAAVAEGRKPIETTWYTAKQMGEITGVNAAMGPTVKYKQNIWFNSAKFLHVVYHVYGNVTTEASKYQDLLEFEFKQQWVVFAIEKQSRKIQGIQSFNIPLRQKLCEKIINQGVRIEEVVDLLLDMIQEPEFNSSFSKALKQYFIKHI